MTIKRVNHGRGHSYINTDTGQKIRGVTTILDKGIPKPALLNWAVGATVDYALDHWDELAAMTPSARQKALQGARWAVKDAAANKGTAVHKLAQRLVVGEAVKVPEELRGHVESYVRFLDEFQVEPILVETAVWDPDNDYCGSFDLLADLTDADGITETWLLDVKTNRSGIFGETALQIAGYRHAKYYLDEAGELQPMPKVTRAGAIWVRADGYDLIPVVAEETQFRQLLYAGQIGEFAEHSRDLIGEPLTPPTTSTYRLERAGDEPEF